MYVCAHARVYQVATAGSGTTLWRAKAEGTAKCGRLKEAVARDDGREEETGDVYVVVILRVCTRKISIRDVSARANEDANVLVVPYFGCAPGKAGE